MMSKLIDPLEYASYDKITDEIYWLNNNLILKFSVSLNHTDTTGKRSNFHKEYRYFSTKAGKPINTIKRSFDFYLSLESIQNKNIFIQIRIMDMPVLIYTLNEVYKWYNDSAYNGLYATKNGNLILTKPYPSTTINFSSRNSYIKFEPIVMINNLDELEPGIRLYISDKSITEDINLPKFVGFKYIIDNFNLYESAQLMLNYFQRPEFGTFMYSFIDDQDKETKKINNQQSNNSNRRKLPGKDDINDLE